MYDKSNVLIKQGINELKSSLYVLYNIQDVNK